MASLSTYKTNSGGTSIQTGDVIQITTNSYINNSAHVQPTGTSLTSTGATGTITPTKAGNLLLVECTLEMSYGYDSHPLVVALYRSGNGVTDGYIVNVNQSYPNYYGWCYIRGQDWGSNHIMWRDTTHNTTQELTYTLYHRRWSGSTNSFSAHRGHPIHFQITEIET